MREYGHTAYAQHDFAMFGVRIWLVQHLGPDRLAVAQPTDLVYREHDDAGTETPPTLRLRDDMGMALLDALAAHYGGHSDLRKLRQDYDAERARVDRMLAHLIREPQR